MYSTSNIPQLLGIMVKGAVTAAVAPGEGLDSVVSASKEIVKAVAPDLAEHVVASLDYHKFREFLLKPHLGSTNRDLDKLIKSALVRAVGFIRRLYIDQLKKEQELGLWERLKTNPLGEIESVLDNLEEDLKFKLTDPLEKKELEAILTGKSDSCFEQLTEYLFNVSGVDTSDAEWLKLRQFFREQLPVMFNLAYKEALKEKENEKAFKEFQIWVLEGVLKSQNGILEGQERVIEIVRELKQDGIPNYVSKVVSAFESSIATESDKILNSLNDVISQLDRIEIKVNRIVDITTETNERLIGLKRSIEEKIPSSIPHELNIIPSYGGEFVGREEDLKRVEGLLQKSSKIVLMNGLGGIGKTTLAKVFIHQKKSNYNHILWLDSAKRDSGRQEDSLQTSFVDMVANQTLLFANLRVFVNPEDRDNFQQFLLIMNALRNLPGKNLMVIDNADQELARKEIREALPIPPNWHVLVTSRQRLTGFSIVLLDKLHPSKAKELFLFYYPYPANSGAIEELLEAIDYHTLTIELFSKTLKEHYGAISVKQLLEKVRAKKLNDPGIQRKIETEHSEEATEVFLHLSLVFDLSPLSEPEVRLLKQLTLLPPQFYDVNLEVAQWLQINKPGEKRIFNESVSSLVRKGWLTQDGNKVVIHRVIQELVSYQGKLDWNDVAPLIGSIAELLASTLGNAPAQAQPVVSLASWLLETVERDMGKRAELIQLRFHLHLLYRITGMYTKALEHIEVLITRYRIYIPDEGYYEWQIHKGILLKELGRYPEATTILELLLKEVQNNENLLGSIENGLGVLYKNMQQLDKSIDYLGSALKRAKRTLGNTDPHISTILSNLATAYTDKKDYFKAKLLLEEAMQIDRGNNFVDQPEVLNRHNNYATLLSRVGFTRQAIQAFANILPIYESLYGSEHPLVAKCQANLALEYVKLGEYSKAKPLFIKSLNIGRSQLGDGHERVIDRRNSLIGIYFKLNEFENAQRLLEEQLIIQSKKLGERHMDIATLQEMLGMAFFGQNKFEEAIDRLSIAKEIFLFLNGPNCSRLPNILMAISFSKDMLSKK